MKKAASIFLLFFYLIPVIGISVTTHYCGGKVSSVSLTLSGEEKCGCKGPMKKGCCSDKTLTFKVDDDQQKPVLVLSDNKQTGQDFFGSVFPETFFYAYFTPKIFKYSYPPPGDMKQSLFLLNKVLRV